MTANCRGDVNALCLDVVEDVVFCGCETGYHHDGFMGNDSFAVSSTFAGCAGMFIE